ncbi:hypothetical protein NPA07_03210 [Mycoplasmopsis caviae]|uniref:Uncharacterized protein n=1 Tax=Mycoplasmopsis caviae TaxID=55603 RepID=A0A3P8LIL2_9BACT|nr:hypothetical protein [Mycoplasmopsis caviae]UUD34805.1 hypothetical protein NPA07_03210 [Mycoplasmopsis caviae]VDR42342.1 Uncharacterised protein [Mycoplasmopsis caviae]
MASLTIEQFITLCDFDGNIYIQKSGDDYIKALSKVFLLKNKNDSHEVNP